MNRANVVWTSLLLLSASTASCVQILGHDKDYYPAGDGGGDGSPHSSGSGGAGPGGAGPGGGAPDGGAGGTNAPHDGPPSCAALAKTCGPMANEDCCAVLDVEGGTFDRDNNDALPATVSSFQLDRFEVTVGRFRAFLQAWPASRPAAGAGAHPRIPDTGWISIWDQSFPATSDEFSAAITSRCNGPDPLPLTWTPEPGAYERMPANCINWFEAFAFCAWDGGRLPTEAEWNYAAAGGSDQRVYPWGRNADAIDTTFAVYNCTADGSGASSCGLSDIFPVGSRSPKGDGLWHHADLAGSVWEWVRDSHSFDYPLPCVDCATIEPEGHRRIRGGSWYAIAANVTTDYWLSADPVNHAVEIGFRCARDVE